MQKKIADEDFRARINSLSILGSTLSLRLPAVIERKYLEHNDVRIYPAAVVMENAFEMKQFSEKIVIKNCGRTMANVRILSPNSNYFALHTIPNGISIAPGVEIVRYIKHEYRAQTSLQQVTFPILINDFEISYNIIVSVPQVVVSLDTDRLDYGKLDVGDSDRKTVTLTNTGHKSGQYHVDIVHSLELQIMVCPKKGIVPALKSVTIDIEVIAMRPGKYLREVWIKTEPLQRVLISLEIIAPELLPMHPQTDYHITIIDFPRIYFGSSCTKSLVINNHSALPTMFYVMAEVEGQLMEVEKAAEEDANYVLFTISCVEGRIAPHGAIIIEIKFSPRKSLVARNKTPIGLIRIIKIPFRDITAKDNRNFSKLTVQTKFFIASFPEYISAIPEDDTTPVKTSIDSAVSKNRTLDASEMIGPSLSSHFDIHQEENKMLRVCFNGNVEVPSMSVRPESIVIRGNIDETYQHVLLLKNDSKYLPIIFRYVKTAFVNIKPKIGTLSPSESKEVVVKITPRHRGDHKSKVVFQLLYRNECTDKEMEVLGEVGVDVAITGFFPDSNRLIRKETVKLDEELPTLSDYKYAFTLKELDARNINRTYYINFIRTYGQKNVKVKSMTPIAEDSDYQLTNKNHLLLQNIRCAFASKDKPSKHLQDTIPLPPSKLYHIKIEPTQISLGQISYYSCVSTSFTVTNNNDFPINIHMKSSKSAILVPDGQVIKANSTKEIKFNVMGNQLGNLAATLAVLINFSHIFEIICRAEVTLPVLSCNEMDITINPEEPCHIFTVSNPVLTAIEYRWLMSDSKNFEVYPDSGFVPPKTNMYFLLKYRHKVNPMLNAQMTLRTFCNEETLIIKVEEKKLEYAFDVDVVNYGSMTINKLITKEIYLKNMSDSMLSFQIQNHTEAREIQMNPVSGIIKPMSIQPFQITAKFRDVIDFSKTFNMSFDQRSNCKITVNGSCKYPVIKLKPTTIHFPKIAPQAISQFEFSVTNISDVFTNVKFLMDELPEFSVKDFNGNILKDIRLNPKEKRSLYLQFMPEEAVAYGVYLPIKINNIIGPPRLNVAESLIPKNYLSTVTLFDTKPAEVPIKLPTITITCACGGEMLRFSRLNVNFNYNLGKIYEEIKIKNLSDQKIRLLLDTSTLEEPFQLEVTGCKVTDFGQSHLIRFQPGDVAFYHLKFNPVGYGDYTLKLPIYLKEYYENCIFNYITITGVYDEPKIIFLKRALYFEVTLPGLVEEQVVSIKLENHRPGCKISVTCDVEFIKISINKSEDSALISLEFAPKTVCQIDGISTYTCTCGGASQLILRAVTGKSITIAYVPIGIRDSVNSYTRKSYLEPFVVESITSWDSFLKYPYFPLIESSRYYYEKFSVLGAVEYWLYSQGFLFKEYYKIPLTISRYFEFQAKDKEKIKDKKEKRPNRLPVQQLLINLCGYEILKYVEYSFDQDYPSNIKDTVYSYNVYKKVLALLREYGMKTVHIYAELLLSYDQYLVFKEFISDPDSDVGRRHITLEKLYFYSLSTQIWLDLILHIYKIFVVSKVSQTINSKKVRFHLDEQFYEYHDSLINEITAYDKEEDSLLLWLEFIYNNNKHLIDKNLDVREVRNFTAHLQDGIIFAVLIAAYCPYMINEVSKIIHIAPSLETCIHNACVVTSAFRTLKFSLSYDPLYIVYPNIMEMLMLVTYLFDVLPSMYPTETVEMTCALAESSERDVNLKNTSDFPICYVGVLLPQSTLFSVEPQVVVVPPNSKRRIKIVYNAQKIFEANATLLLSGETKKFKYAKSMVFTLHGVPTYKSGKSVRIGVPLYKSVTKKLTIVSPYKSYECDIYACINFPPESRSDFITWQEWNNLNIPRQVYSKATTMSFNYEGVGYLYLDICYIVPGIKNFFIFFLHPNGDFCLKVDIKVSKRIVAEQLTIEIPERFVNKCVCKKGVTNPRCPKALVVNIPCKNRALWDALLLLLKTSRPTEEHFWRKYLRVPVGIFILKVMMGTWRFWEREEFDDLFDNTVEYRVNIGKQVVAQPSIVIPDTTLEDEFVPLVIHMRSDNPPTKETLTLNAKHGRENRDYSLLFLGTTFVNEV